LKEVMGMKKRTTEENLLLIKGTEHPEEFNPD
jgi:hypothetical protein